MPRLYVAAFLALAITIVGCTSVHVPSCLPGEQRAISDVLYFGTAKPHGVVTPEEWAEFLRSTATPRFPRGLTVWQASGQWQSAGGAVAREDAHVLNLVHPDNDPTEKAIREIVAEYKSQFQQDAVLRVKAHTCVSF